MRKLTTKTLQVVGFFLLYLFSLPLFSQVPVNINSGDPNFPFPQFLEYDNGKSLALYNADGVTHADMEKAIREAYQIMANRFEYASAEYGIPAVTVDGVKYIVGNEGCPYFCAEGAGYALLAAAYMGDKTTFDGLWMSVHDNMLTGVNSYETGNPLDMDYRYGTHTLREKLRSSDAAADGDMDIGLALLMATKQWGSNSGVFVADGSEMNYLSEAINVIADMADTVRIEPLGSPGVLEGYVSGHIGLDGYPKGGNTFGETTHWAETNAIFPSKEVYSNDGNQSGFASYTATAYYHSFGQFLDENNVHDFARNQYWRAEASSNWIMEQNHAQGRLPYAGSFNVTDTNVNFTNVDPTQGKCDGESFRMPWRTILDYVWRGNQDKIWDPTTHTYTSGGNSSAMKDNADTLAAFLLTPENGSCEQLGASPDVGSPSFKGLPIYKQGYGGDGTKCSGNNWTNFALGASSAAAVAYGDEELIANLYRQLELKWDDDQAGPNVTDDERYIDSEPIYFHGWFRLLGMLTLSGNLHAPENMVAGANMKVYMQAVNKTFAFTGDTVTYKVSYRNYGSVTANQVNIDIPISDQYSILDAGLGSYSNGTKTLSFTPGTVPGFKTATGIAPTTGEYTFKVIVNSPVIDSRVCLTAEITSQNGTGWISNEFPNNATYTYEQNCVDILAERSLKIEKTSSADQVNPDSTVDFFLDFENSTDAGFLNGGRPKVDFSFGHLFSGTSTINYFFRNWHNAEEAYIDLSNYRVSYFIFDNANIGLYDPVTNPVGWKLTDKNMRSGEDYVLNYSSETIPTGQTADGSKKWNQRIIMYFPDDISAPTHTLYSHLKNGFQIHKGELEPVWYRVLMEAVPTDILAPKLADDWSFDNALETSNDKDLYHMVSDHYLYGGGSYTVDSYGENVCTPTPPGSFDGLLIEEWDGTTWRRIAGNGPLTGREMHNVTIVDTIPSGLEFVSFINQKVEGINATVTTSGGYEIVSWTMPVMLAGTKGTISYTTRAKGACPQTDKLYTNTGWIWSKTDSPTSSSVDVTVTCDVIVKKADVTTMTKEADKKFVTLGDKVTFDIEYEQTHGTFNTPSLNDASDWTLVQGALPTFGSNKMVFGWNSQVPFITHDYAYGHDGYAEFDVKWSGGKGHQIALRHNTNTYPDPNGVYVSIWSQSAGIAKVKVFNGSTEIYSQLGVGIGTSADDFKMRAYIHNDTLELFFGGLGTDFSKSLPTLTIKGVNDSQQGYFGIYNKSEYSVENTEFSNMTLAFDAAFDVGLVDPLPLGLVFDSSPDGTMVDGGNGEVHSATTIPGPVEYGTILNYQFIAEVNDCQPEIINTAWQQLKTYGSEVIGATADTIFCSGDITCQAPGTIDLNISATEDVCGSSLEIIATPTGTAPTGGFEYEFFYDDGSGFTSVQAASSDSTYIATAAGDYYVEVTDPADPTTCSAVSITSTITFSTPLTPDVTIDVDNTTLCEGQIANFSIDVASDSGSTPTYQWLVNDVAVSLEINNTFSTTTLSNGDVVSLEMTIAETCNTKFIDTSNEIVMTINPVLTPEVTITADVLTICNGETVNFDIASAVDSGATPTYRWLVNDIAVSAEINNTFSTASLVDGDVISLEMTIAETCQTKSIDTSNAIMISVGNPLTPQVTITSDATAICAGETVNFSIATAVDSGSTPTYRWLVNDVAVSTEVNNTFSTASLTNGDVVSLEMTIAETCITKGQDTSNVVSISVSGSVTPTAVIAATTSINICPGDSVAIEVTEQNGAGASPTYEWYINNVLDGTQTTDMFSSKTLTTGDSVYVTISDLSSCATATSVISEAIYINEIAPLTPSITIDMSTSSICAGETVDFSILSAIDSGATPTYQWLLNDVAISLANERTYSTTTLTNGDIISLEMTIAETCHTKTIDTSNQETITVTSPVTPQVTINASANTICTGDIVDFSILSASDSGATPSYEWLLNGSPISLETNNMLSINTLTDNDSIAIVMTSSESCVAVTKDTSNYVPITVTGAIAPEVTIVATTATTICAGDSVAFEVTNTIGDNGSPAFEWFINGVSTSQTGATFFSKTLVDEDTVTVRMSGTSTCATVTDTLSNAIGITITPAGVPDITIDADKNLICAGEEVNFSIASQTNEGTNPTYEWFVNTASNGTGTTFSSSSLVTGDDITVVMTSDLSCAAVPTATSNIETITVSAPVTPSVTTVSSETDICLGDTVTFNIDATTNEGNAPTYTWYLGDSPVVPAETGTTYTTSSLKSFEEVSVQMTVSETCVTSQIVESTPLTVNVNTGNTPTITIIPSTLKACDTDNITFSTTSTHEGTNPIYNWYFDNDLQLSSTPTITGKFNSNTDVKVVMISDEECALPTAVSDVVSVDISSTTPVTLSTIPTIPLCDQFYITANYSGTSIQWYNQDGPIDGADQSTLLVTESNLYYAVSNDGVCPDVTSVNATINVYKTPTVSAGSNTTIYTGDDYTMNGSVDVATSTISWTSNNSDVITDASSLNAIVEPTTTTVYTITADNNGCTDTASVVISVVKPVLIPNVFTPNGTGTNDTWVIDGLETYSDCSVTVFNRWGMKVFNTAGYDSPWDGCMEDGKLLPTATYFYVIDLGDGTEPISGTVTIIK